LEHEKLLLVLSDQQGTIYIFLEALAAIEGAIKRKKSRRHLHRDKLGHEVIMAFDEAKRMLVVCGAIKVRKLFLHMYMLVLTTNY
jgi:hypothetical protein